ncbi:MAG: cyclase family protein [Saprospiraceae bacterium]|nr:cyclase family protein [Saprospiraceae bacterium]
MEIIFKWDEKYFEADLSKPLDISIPLENENAPIAFGAPPFKAEPFQAGEFIGSLEAGAPVNFYNLHINPHGNGTHTESVRHIDPRGLTINQTLKKFHFIAQVISIQPTVLDNGDRLISMESLSEKIHPKVEALIIRTLPNDEDKKTRNYTGTNPCYISPDVIAMLNKTCVTHLLIDTPSVDREEDGGRLSAHKTFWGIKDAISLNKTITEMVYVDNTVQDGLFLLNIQLPSVESDAAPSKPVLFKIVSRETFK